MESIKLVKKSISGIESFLDSILINGASSRARTKLLKDIIEQMSEIEKEEIALAESFGGKVNKGYISFDETDEGKSNKINFEKEHTELLNEKIKFEERSEGHFNKLKNSLLNYEEKLSGSQAEAFDNLLDAFEELPQEA